MNSSSRVAVLNYGAGNVRSIMNALAVMNCDAVLSDKPEDIEASDKLIIPGVGAFAFCMSQLTENGLDVVIKQFAHSGKPILGICVGMQMLFDASEEYGEHPGLGLLPGRVKRLPIETNDAIRLPHIGWNNVEFSEKDVSTCAEFYFVHSFSCFPDKSGDVYGASEYAGVTFTSAVKRNNICGVQFHPERSGTAGIEFLTDFVEVGK
ncbi:imidazole glycerol phosphate synthase subunit HisH [Aurantivibrio plasticivorans]